MSIDGEMLNTVLLQYEVPQGFLLGPSLFTIYVRGLASLLDAHDVIYHFYADDGYFYNI